MTVTASPLSLYPVHDDLVYTVTESSHTSDPVTYPNYKFIAEIFVEGVQVATLRKVPNPLNGVGEFNISQVVRKYVNAVFNPSPSNLLSQVLSANDFYVTVDVNFGEEYAFTSYYDIVEDNNKVLVNSYNKTSFGVLPDFYNRATLGLGFMTNMPSVREVMLSANQFYLTYFSATSTTVAVAIDAITGASTVSHTTNISVVANSLHLLNVAPALLNSLYPGFITSSTEYYLVTIGSEIYKINLVCESINEIIVLHFLNAYGGYDSKLFTKVSRKSVSFQKKSFDKRKYTIADDGSVSTFTSNNPLIANEIKYTYASTFNEKLVVNSDLLTDGEYRWLYELIASSQIIAELRIENTDDYISIPCKLTDTDYEIRKIVNDGLTNLTLTIEYGPTLNAQFR